MHKEESQPIIFFDGVCNLCVGTVQFLLERNKNNNLLFAALSGISGQQLLCKNELSSHNFNSILLLENGKLYQRSTAALKISRHLNGLWPVLYLFIIVPAFLRDLVYDFVANNRYKWFGKRDECWLPTAELKKRFLD
jgi:predicted DCC family thiol-disulfide oxidoreductase YuxK